MKIKTNSREVVKGDTFVAIKGENHDGHDYILEAIGSGAVKIICESGKYDVATEVVQSTKTFLAEYLDKQYKKKLGNLKIIGITGTNGKTTTAYLINQLLNRLGTKSAYIGTLGFYIEENKVKDLNNTTPDTLEIYNLLLKALKNGCEYVVMEVSSHALEQERIGKLRFDIALFTNLTKDHLDYHKTMEEYLKSKRKILRSMKLKSTLIVNSDDEYAKFFEFVNRIEVGKKARDYKIKSYKFKNGKSYFKFRNKWKIYKQAISLPAKFNVYNYLMAVAAVNVSGYTIEEIQNIEVDCPKGRSQTINFNNNLIVVDYAHTPDAVEKICQSFKEITKGRVVTVVGCGGNRDKTKRPIMAGIATANSDYVIFTSDNPRNEEPEEIIVDMISNLENTNYEVILDRKKAIDLGISKLKINDTLLILGKGHENYQMIKGIKYHLDDMEIVLNKIKD